MLRRADERKKVINAEEYAKKHELPWVRDPKGFFHILADKRRKEIHVLFSSKYSERRDRIEKIIVGKSPEPIYETIIQLGLISRLEHAAYLGKELQKAYESLRTKRKYIQERLWISDRLWKPYYRKYNIRN
jgi:dihydropteroate synthase